VYGQGVKDGDVIVVSYEVACRDATVPGTHGSSARGYTDGSGFHRGATSAERGGAPRKLLVGQRARLAVRLATGECEAAAAAQSLASINQNEQQRLVAAGVIDQSDALRHAAEEAMSNRWVGGMLASLCGQLPTPDSLDPTSVVSVPLPLAFARPFNGSVLLNPGAGAAGLRQTEAQARALLTLADPAYDPEGQFKVGSHASVKAAAACAAAGELTFAFRLLSRAPAAAAGGGGKGGGTAKGGGKSKTLNGVGLCAGDALLLTAPCQQCTEPTAAVIAAARARVELQAGKTEAEVEAELQAQEPPPTAAAGHGSGGGELAPSSQQCTDCFRWLSKRAPAAAGILGQALRAAGGNGAPALGCTGGAGAKGESWWAGGSSWWAVLGLQAALRVPSRSPTPVPTAGPPTPRWNASLAPGETAETAEAARVQSAKEAEEEKEELDGDNDDAGGEGE
jgi:hypothetical protein